jgi:hypothetical protein
MFDARVGPKLHVRAETRGPGGATEPPDPSGEPLLQPGGPPARDSRGDLLPLGSLSFEAWVLGHELDANQHALSDAHRAVRRMEWKHARLEREHRSAAPGFAQDSAAVHVAMHMQTLSAAVMRLKALEANRDGLENKASSHMQGILEQVLARRRAEPGTN